MQEITQRSATPMPTPTNRLYQRLQDAMHHGNEVWFRMPSTRLVGIPIYLDSEFVEIVHLDAGEGYDPSDLPDEPYERTVWVIRLAEIAAISYTSESFSKPHLERLIQTTEKISEGDRNSPNA